MLRRIDGAKWLLWHGKMEPCLEQLQGLGVRQNLQATVSDGIMKNLGHATIGCRRLLAADGRRRQADRTYVRKTGRIAQVRAKRAD